MARRAIVAALWRAALLLGMVATSAATNVPLQMDLVGQYTYVNTVTPVSNTSAFPAVAYLSSAATRPAEAASRPQSTTQQPWPSHTPYESSLGIAMERVVQSLPPSHPLTVGDAVSAAVALAFNTQDPSKTEFAVYIPFSATISAQGCGQSSWDASFPQYAGSRAPVMHVEARCDSALLDTDTANITGWLITGIQCNPKCQVVTEHSVTVVLNTQPYTSGVVRLQLFIMAQADGVANVTSTATFATTLKTRPNCGRTDTSIVTSGSLFPRNAKAQDSRMISAEGCGSISSTTGVSSGPWSRCPTPCVQQDDRLVCPMSPPDAKWQALMLAAGPACGMQMREVLASAWSPQCSSEKGELIPLPLSVCMNKFQTCGLVSDEAWLLCSRMFGVRDVEAPSGPTAQPSGQCIALGRDSVPFCQHLTGQKVFLNNLYKNAAQADAYAQQLAQDQVATSYSYCGLEAQLLACSLVFPQCNADGPQSLCLHTCEQAKFSCTGSMATATAQCQSLPGVSDTADCGYPDLHVLDLLRIPPSSPSSGWPEYLLVVWNFTLATPTLMICIILGASAIMLSCCICIHSKFARSRYSSPAAA